jgi:hypothetical protein
MAGVPFLTRRQASLALAGWPLAAAANRPALPPELQAALPGARLLGEATLRWFGLHVYDIRLWAEDARALEQPDASRLALELRYARAIEGDKIAERSLKEMQAIGEVPDGRGERWLAAMRSIFPDVNKGDRITGLQVPAEAALFFVNGEPRGEVRDAQFTRLFFGIWLSPRTSQPALREALLGRKGQGGVS